jgi:hypothetical protein
MPLYMPPKNDKQISRCFNFKTTAEPELIADVTRLAASAAGEWAGFF